MTILYNCRHDGDQYRISKFDNDMNVESSYLCDTDNCECPRGPHHTCRHRQMLPKFIAREHVGDEWFFDFDRGGWVQREPEFIEGLSQTQKHTIIYTTDKPPLEITHVELYAPQEPPLPSYIKRRF